MKRKLALISIRAPRWAKQRGWDNRVDLLRGVEQGRSRVSQHASSECIPKWCIYVAYMMALLGSVHDSIQLLRLEEQRLYLSLNKCHSTVLPYGAHRYPRLDYFNNHHLNDL